MHDYSFNDPLPSQKHSLQASRVALVGIAIAAFTGTFFGVGHLIPIHPILWIFALGFLLILLGHGHAKGVLMCLVVGGAFGFNAYLQTTDFAPHDLSRIITQRQHAYVAGVVRAEPFVTRHAAGRPPLIYIPVKVEAEWLESTWKTASGRLLIEVRGDMLRPPRYGDRVASRGVIQERSGPGLGLSSSLHRLQTEPDGVRVISSGHGHRLLAFCFDMRQRGAALLERGIEHRPEVVGILQAILLGYRNELPLEWAQMFSETGTLHVFAISGLHIGIITWLLVSFLRLLKIPKTRWILILFPLLTLFILATGMKASAIRAGIMACLFYAAPALKRQTDSRTALALSGLIVLWIAPRQLLNVGFLYSFSIVLGLILFAQPLHNWIMKRISLDPWSPDALAPSFSQRVFRSVWRYTSGLIAVSIAAWLISAPISALFFNQISPAALIGNLFVVPASFLIVFTAACSLVFGSIAPIFAEVFNFANTAFVPTVLSWIKVLHGIPGGHFAVPAPAPLLIIAYYGIFWFALFRRKIPPFIRWLFVGFLISTFGIQAAHISQGPEASAYIMTGREHSSVSIRSGRAWMVVDPGPRFEFRYLQRHLRKQGVGRIDVLVCTHSDSDHISSVPRCIDAFEIGELWVPDLAKQGKTLAGIIALARERGIPVVRKKAGDHGMWKQYEINIFGPEAGADPERADDACLVFRINRSPGSIMITGGMSSRQESILESQGASLLMAPAASKDDSLSHAVVAKYPESFVLVSPNASMRDAMIQHEMFKRLESVDAQIVHLKRGDIYRYSLKTHTLSPLSNE